MISMIAMFVVAMALVMVGFGIWLARVTSVCNEMYRDIETLAKEIDEIRSNLWTAGK